MFGCMVNAQRNHVREVNRRADETREAGDAAAEERTGKVEATEQHEVRPDDAAESPRSAG